MKRLSTVFGVSLAMMFTLFLGQPAGATALHAAAPASSGTGPGYELQVSDAIYAFNAPDVNSLPVNPTGGPQKCFTPTWGTCSSIGIASTGDYVSPGYWIGLPPRHGSQWPGWIRCGGHRIRQHQHLQPGINRDLGHPGGRCLLRTVRHTAHKLLMAVCLRFCGALFYGSMGGKPLNKPVVGIASTPDGKGSGSCAS